MRLSIPLRRTRDLCGLTHFLSPPLLLPTLCRDSSRLTELIKNELVPDKILKKKPAKEFVPEVEKIHARAEYTKRKVPVESVQCDVVTQAIRSWPKLFTEFYESATL